MSRLYVDSLFASQGSRKVWASGTASAEVVDTATAFGTIAAALADGAFDDDTVIRVAPGSYAMPATLWDEVIQIEGCGSATTFLTGDCKVEANASVRCENVAISGSWSVFGKVGMVRVAIGDEGGAVATGASGAIAAAEWSGTKPYKTESGAVALYPAARFTVGGPGGRRNSEYRLAGRIEAPAKGRGLAGGDELRWVWLKDVKFRRQEQSGREGQQGSLSFADTTGMLCCRGGVPIHTDMRVTMYGQTYHIHGISQSPSPENELILFVSERTKAV
ncbi:MAG: hypothetical protein E6R03_09515 [Hyphomicrobiaceae bacterium]|nr:MAG: hypothetical protein E6R03_09515 [Hyphomicrobiaceae bacterium]